MKYILICLVAFSVCFGIGFALSKVVWKRKNKWIQVISTVVFGLCFILGVTLGYMSVYYHADSRATKALKGNDSVIVTKIDGGYLFNGPGTESALIFYSGAKVECEAYASLMLCVAEKGMDCFLMDMPLNFAIFGSNFADKVLNNYSYSNVVLSGHSLGGLMASKYACQNSDRVDGVILLASYSTEKISEDIKVLSVYGSLDGCLNREEYEKDKENFPLDTREIVIEGGNHAQFGDYGKQKGDNDASITTAEQQNETAKAIAQYFLSEYQ